MKYLVFIVCILCTISATAQQYELLPTSSITVDGTSTLHDWTVVAEKHSGSIKITAKKVANDMLKKGTITAMTLVIHVRNMTSEKGETMNNKMHRALKMEVAPNITYTLSKPIKFEILDTQSRAISTSGILVIAGTKKTIQSTVKVSFDSGILMVIGKFPFKLSDFDMKPPSAMFGQIETGDNVTVNFRLMYKN